MAAIGSYSVGRCFVSAQKLITEHCDELDDLVRRHDKDRWALWEVRVKTSYRYCDCC